MTLDRISADEKFARISDAKATCKPVIATDLVNFHDPDDVLEIRIPDAGGVIGKIIAGYLPSSRILHHAGEIAIHAVGSVGSYFTLQRLDPACLSRSPCRFSEVSKYKGELRPKLTADADVTARVFLIIDIDAVRAAGHEKDSATDAEKAAAFEVANSVKSFMWQYHWPEPLEVDSGNGCHLYYRLPTPVTRADSPDLDTPAVSRLLKVMNHALGTPGASIDPSVCNPSRVMKIPGTMARKGEDTADRPHRQCRVLKVPEGWRSASTTSAEAPASLVALTLALDPDGSISRDLAVKARKQSAAPVTPGSHSPGDLPPLEKRIGRALKYLARMPAGVEGQKGSDPTYAAATAMVHGFCLDEHSAFALLLDTYNPRCVPPWSESELRHKVADAATKTHTREYGWLLIDKRAVGKVTAVVPPHQAAQPLPVPGVSATPPIGVDGAPSGVDSRRAHDIKRNISAGVEVEEYAVNNQVIEALGKDKTLYERANQLVTIRHGGECQGDKLFPNPGPQIVELELPTIRERISRVVTFTRAVTGEGGLVVEQPMAIPEYCLRAVHKRGSWPGVRPLSGLIDNPIVEKSGRVIDRYGYDHGTQLFSTYDGPAHSDDAQLGQGDARAAADALLELVSEFPFEKDHHRSAWLAALLTPLVRFAFAAEPTPLMLFDATTAGSGKTTLCQVISSIVTGRGLAPNSYIHDDAEFAKGVLATAMQGARMHLFDNVEGPFGNATLKLVLTSTEYSGRVLGQTKNVSVPVYTCWYATANNIRLTADMDRRVCAVKLAPDVEHPEELTGFKIPNLLEHVNANRQRLLALALQLLTAHIHAGFPGATLRPYGGYIGWSKFVRGAIVWAGLPDPIQTNDDSRQVGDPKLDAMKVLMGNWEAISPRGEALTGRAILAAVTPSNLGAAFDDVSQALSELREQSPKCLGVELRAAKGRVFGGRKFVSAGSAQRSVRWSVVNSDGSPLDYGATSTPTTPTQMDIYHCGLQPRTDDTPRAGEGDGAAPSFPGGEGEI